MRPLLFRLLSTAVVLTALVSTATAADEPAFRFAKIFTDQMILQQQKPIIVWGWATPGTTVAVTLTQDRKFGAQAMARVLELEVQKGIRRPAPPEDDGSHSVTVQYVEKNPPKPITQIIDAKAGADG